jgi:hypothetical protein
MANAQLSRTPAAAEHLGLVITVTKTECMTVNCSPQSPLEVYEQPIKHEPDFRNLGSMRASSINDLTRRKALAWTAFWKLEKIWRSSTISIATKVKLFNVTCVTVFLYGCDSWILSPSMDAFATSCYRIMLNIMRADHVTNAKVYQMTGSWPLITTVRQRQLRFFGHILRRSEDEPCRSMPFIPRHMAEGKPRGR